MRMEFQRKGLWIDKVHLIGNGIYDILIGKIIDWEGKIRGSVIDWKEEEYTI